MTDKFQYLTEDKWEEEYEPTYLDHDPEGIDAKYVWTEVESDGHYAWSSGRRLVNRTGNYAVTKKVHNFDVEVDVD